MFRKPLAKALSRMDRSQGGFQIMDRRPLGRFLGLLDGAGKTSHRNRQIDTDATNRRKYSMRLICEAKLRLANANYTIEHAIKDLAIHCRSISQNNGQYELDFAVATAAIRAHEESLLIRVEAEETIISDGTKMLISSQISSHAINMPMNILWVDASEEPFATILAPEKLGKREDKQANSTKRYRC